MTAKNQEFEPAHNDESRDIAYFAHGLTVDAVDLSIRAVEVDDDDNRHAKVDLIFLQDKGTRRREVVTAVRMQLFELEAAVNLINRKINAFNDKR